MRPRAESRGQSQAQEPIHSYAASSQPQTHESNPTHTAPQPNKQSGYTKAASPVPFQKSSFTTIRSPLTSPAPVANQPTENSDMWGDQMEETSQVQDPWSGSRGMYQTSELPAR